MFKTRVASRQRGSGACPGYQDLVGVRETLVQGWVSVHLPQALQKRRFQKITRGYRFRGFEALA